MHTTTDTTGQDGVRQVLATEREDLLGAVGRDEQTLRADAARGNLIGDEWYAAARLDAIDKQLGALAA